MIYMIYLCCPPALRDILHTRVARYSLFVLKVSLNIKQTNKLSVVDMRHVHLSLRLNHQSAAACVLNIIGEHIPEVSSPSLYFTITFDFVHQLQKLLSVLSVLCCSWGQERLGNPQSSNPKCFSMDSFSLEQ